MLFRGSVCLNGVDLYFCKLFNALVYVRHDIGKIVGRPQTITISAGSKILSKTLVKSDNTTEKRLMVNIRAAKKAFKRIEIRNNGLFR